MGTQLPIGHSARYLRCAGSHEIRECSIEKENLKDSTQKKAGIPLHNIHFHILKNRPTPPTRSQIIQENNLPQTDIQIRESRATSYAEMIENTQKPSANFANDLTELDEIKTLLKDLKDLNKICNINKMIETVKRMKSKLLTARNNLENIDSISRQFQWVTNKMLFQNPALEL